MQTGWNENSVVLCGTVAECPTPSHENHGMRYHTFPLVIKRLSQQEDIINVVGATGLLELAGLHKGDRVAVTGEIRSFNNKSGQGRRLVITVYARSVTPWEGEDSNDLVLSGVLCKPPTYRMTPLGREICDLMLAVNRKYGRADYLPCISWGSLAQRCGNLAVGDGIRLEGRLQSRNYTKMEGGTPQLHTAYEVSIMQMEQDK